MSAPHSGEGEPSSTIRAVKTGGRGALFLLREPLYICMRVEIEHGGLDARGTEGGREGGSLGPPIISRLTFLLPLAAPHDRQQLRILLLIPFCSPTLQWRLLLLLLFPVYIIFQAHTHTYVSRSAADQSSTQKRHTHAQKDAPAPDDHGVGASTAGDPAGAGPPAARGQEARGCWGAYPRTLGPSRGGGGGGRRGYCGDESQKEKKGPAPGCRGRSSWWSW